MMAPTLRTGMACACLACGLMASPLTAIGQFRTASFAVPVRITSAGCTMTTATSGQAALVMNCGGVVTTVGAAAGPAAVGGAVRTSALTGASALSVMSTTSAARGGYGTAPSAGLSSSQLRVAPNALGPAGLEDAAAVEDRRPARGTTAEGAPREPAGDIGEPRGQDIPIPEPVVKPDEPPETGPTFRISHHADLPSQVSRVRMDGHVQMLVVF